MVMTRITEDMINAWMTRGYLTQGLYEEMMCEARKNDRIKEDIDDEEI